MLNDRSLRQPLLRALAVAVAILPAVIGGCGGPPPLECPGPGALAVLAAPDSLGLDAFLALPRADRDLRRESAASLFSASRRQPTLDRRIGLLGEAAGLAPDDPQVWLELAEILRWVGTDMQAETVLEGAMLAIRRLQAGTAGRDERRGGIRRWWLRAALLQAWLHYDRAEWREGLGWARSVLTAFPGNAAGRTVTGLLAANLGRRTLAREAAGDLGRADPYATEPAWIQAMIERGQGLPREALSFLLTLRPRGGYAAECWRDMGLAAEQAGEWSYAQKWYRESAVNLPLADKGCIRETTGARLDPGTPAMPVWLGMGRTYVTGSRSAYTALALERFEAAGAPADREFWAGEVVNSAGICLRLGVDRAWALRAKGLVFAATGMDDRALEDLERASEELGGAGRADPRIERELGRLYLVKEVDRKAAEHLARAVALDETDARAWSDLGLARVRLGERDLARQALDRAIALDPGMAAALYNRGLLSLHTGDLEGAEADLAEAAKLAPENQEIIRLLQRVTVARQRRGESPLED